MERIKLLLHKPGYRYLLIGGSVYGFELAIILLAQKLGASANWSVAISFTLGTLVSFFLQKIITFSDKRMHHRILIPQLVATALLISWNLGFSVLLTNLLQHHMPAVVTRTLAIAVTTIWNFYLYKTHIFKSTDSELLG